MEYTNDSDPIPIQDAKWLTALQGVTFSNVQRLLDSIQLEAKSLQFLDQDEGVINMIFVVEAVCKSSKEPISLILRVSNPYRYWKRRKQDNEIQCLNLIHRWNAFNPQSIIPVPRIYAYSSDAATSILGCEFSLVQKMSGINGSRIYQLDLESKKRFWKDYMDVLQSIRSIPASLAFGDQCENTNVFGTFQFGAKTAGPLIVDTHWDSGPYTDFHTLLLEQVTYSIQLMDESWEVRKYLSEEDCTTLKEQSLDVLEHLKKLNLPLSRLALTHDDLHSGNFLIDPETGHIVAVLDWDRAYWGSHNMKTQDFCRSVCGHLFAAPEDATYLSEQLALVEADYPSSGLDKALLDWFDLSMSVMDMVVAISTWFGPPKPNGDEWIIPNREDQSLHYIQMVEAFRAQYATMNNIFEHASLHRFVKD